METVIIVVAAVIIVFWFVIPYYIAIFRKDTKKIRTCTSLSIFKIEQELEKNSAQISKDTEAQNTSGSKTSA